MPQTDQSSHTIRGDEQPLPCPSCPLLPRRKGLPGPHPVGWRYSSDQTNNPFSGLSHPVAFPFPFEDWKRFSLALLLSLSPPQVQQHLLCLNSPPCVDPNKSFFFILFCPISQPPLSPVIRLYRGRALRACYHIRRLLQADFVVWAPSQVSSWA